MPSPLIQLGCVVSRIVYSVRSTVVCSYVLRNHPQPHPPGAGWLFTVRSTPYRVRIGSLWQPPWQPPCFLSLARFGSPYQGKKDTGKFFFLLPTQSIPRGRDVESSPSSDHSNHESHAIRGVGFWSPNRPLLLDGVCCVDVQYQQAVCS